jgi:Uma2 family endonuclease
VETRAREKVQEKNEIRRRRFTAEEYHLMGEAGIFGEGERVELIEGEVVQMNPIGSRHAACVRILTRLLGRSLDDEFFLDVQNPVKINGGLEPQPDLMVVRARDYKDSLPGPEDVLLLIEVSDTTLSYDRNVKLPLYAKAGIRESWIVDLAGESIERHNDPSQTGYGRMQRVGPEKTLASEALSDLILNTDSLIG